MTGALILLGLAVLVWWGPSPPQRLRRLEAAQGEAASRVWLPWALLSAATVLGGVLVGYPGFVLAAVIASGIIGWLLVRGRKDRRRRDARQQVSASATSLALLMRSGMIPTVALREAATGSPCLESAATAHRLGTDVAAALERASNISGQEGLSAVAAAWQVSARTGAPIAMVVDRVAETLRESQQIQGVLEAEMSAARISGRIMACLPLFGLLLGTGMGADPLGFLSTHRTGEWLVLAGVLLSVAGILWTERIARRIWT